MELASSALLIALVLILILILVLIGRSRLANIPRKTYALPYYGKERIELNDRLRTGLRSLRFELINGKQSELTKLHNKLKTNDITDSSLNIFASDKQKIMFEMSDESDEYDEIYDNGSIEIGSGDTVERIPIPITLNLINSSKWFFLFYFKIYFIDIFLKKNYYYNYLSTKN